VPTEGGDIPEEPDSPEATAEQALELGWQRAERLAMGFASAPAPPAPALPVPRAQRSAPPAGRQRPHPDARTLAVVRPLPDVAALMRPDRVRQSVRAGVLTHSGASGGGRRVCQPCLSQAQLPDCSA